MENLKNIETLEFQLDVLNVKSETLKNQEKTKNTNLGNPKIQTKFPDFRDFQCFSNFQNFQRFRFEHLEIHFDFPEFQREILNKY